MSPAESPARRTLLALHPERQKILQESKEWSQEASWVYVPLRIHVVEGQLSQAHSSTHTQTTETKLSIAMCLTDILTGQFLKSSNESGIAFETNVTGPITRN